MRTIIEPKSERIDIRISPTIKTLLQQAATASHKSITEFLIEHGLSAAEETLTDRKIFSLNKKQWDKFKSVLDQPTKDKPRLKKLLTAPSVFD